MLPKPDIATPHTGHETTNAGTTDQLRFDSELIEAIGNPVYLKDREGRFICVNRAWEQFYGIRREDCVGKTVHEVFPKDAADAHAVQDAALMGGSGPRVYALQVLGSDGEMHDTVHYKSVFSHADGTPAGVIGNLTDVTSLKRTEAKLANTRERLHFALQGSGLALWDANFQNDEVFFSAEWAQMLGFPPEETVIDTKALIARVHPDDRERTGKAINDVIRGTKSSYREEHRLATQSGDWKWVESRGMVVERDAQGTAVRMTGTNADITERMAGETSLRASEMQLRLVIENVPALIAYLDVDRRYRFVNKRYAEFFGFSPEEIIGKSGIEVIGEHAYREYVGYFDEVMAGTRFCAVPLDCRVGL